jgi:hypothetical protein
MHKLQWALCKCKNCMISYFIRQKLPFVKPNEDLKSKPDTIVKLITAA